MKRRNVPIVPLVCELDSSVPAQSARWNKSRRHSNFCRMRSCWKRNGAQTLALAQKLEEDRAQQSSRAPGAIFLRQARFALVLRKLLQDKERIAHSCYEFPCAGLRAHIKEAPRCDSKRHDRAAIGVTARMDPERVVRMCGRSSEQSEIGRATRWHVLPGQNNVPFCSDGKRSGESLKRLISI